MTNTSLHPAERITALDILRGIAVPGILIMNIQSFAMIGTAYINPMSYGDMTGLNKWVWIFSNVFASEKFMSLFSILFGAGMLLFIGRAKEKGFSPGILHYRRMFWLFIFGMIHAYLIWEGDILVAYSLCGLLLYLFRKKKPGTLFLYSALFFPVPVIINFIFGISLTFWPREDYMAALSEWAPAAEEIKEEISVMTGSLASQFEKRAESAFWMQSFLFIWWTFWRAMSMMLLGMALFKTGVLSGSKSKSFYINMALIGISAGYLISGFGVYENFKAEFNFNFSMFFGSIYNYIGSAATVLGYIGCIMVVVKSSRMQSIKSAISNVGRMAFSNYILMSLLCGFIFYGHGLGLYGSLSRVSQMGVVIGVWAVLFVFSHLWLKRFEMGPLEMLWRRLTYWNVKQNSETGLLSKAGA
jgi:uncharacterized protein